MPSNMPIISIVETLGNMLSISSRRRHSIKSLCAGVQSPYRLPGNFLLPAVPDSVISGSTQTGIGSVPQCSVAAQHAV